MDRDISIVIVVYDKYDYLECVLKSLEKQSYKKFEVIIAEDCKKEKIVEWRERYSFTIRHVYQEDIGFKKNKILNKALKIINGKYIIILDGDCIVYKEFVKNYMKYFSQNYDVVFERRCEMSETLSKKILKYNGDYKIKLFDLIFPYSKAWTEAVYLPFYIERKKRKLRLLGSNMGFTKDIIFKINEFNEDYFGAGIGEDTDLQWRLLEAGTKYIVVKNKLIQYHLYHKRNDRGYNEIGWEIYRKTQEKNEWYTKNRIIKVSE